MNNIFSLILMALLCVFVSERAFSQVYYISIDGDISDEENVKVEDKKPVDVIAILDEGTDINSIVDANRGYEKYFHFVNPVSASAKYSVLFSISSTDEIIDRYMNSDIVVNKVVVDNGLMQENKSCFIRIVYDDYNMNLVAYNMYVLDGDYNSYTKCVSLYASKFKEIYD